VGQVRRRDHVAHVGRVAAGHPSQRQWLRFEWPDTPSSHLILVAGRQMNDSYLMMSRGLMHQRRGPGIRTVDLFHRFFNGKIIH
jgi:hypothetical protein